MTPLLEAISSPQCRLKTIKMSIGSLSKLDLQSCKLLGSLLKLVIQYAYIIKNLNSFSLLTHYNIPISFL